MNHGTELVGIVNVTPDSFSDGGNYLEENAAVAHTNELFNQGCSMVDIGGESTRPDATPISHEKEWSRIAGVLGQTIPVYGESISVDSYHPTVIRRAFQFGNFVVNDVTGFNNPEMQDVVAELGLPCIVSHLPASAGQDIQLAHKTKEVDSVDQVVDELEIRVCELITRGVHKSKITVDPGIGFSKTMKANWKLLGIAEHTDWPVMIGASNKSFLRTDPGTGLIYPGYEKPDASAEAIIIELDQIWMNGRNRYAANLAMSEHIKPKYLRVHDPIIYKDLVH